MLDCVILKRTKSGTALKLQIVHHTQGSSPISLDTNMTGTLKMTMYTIFFKAYSMDEYPELKSEKSETVVPVQNIVHLG